MCSNPCANFGMFNEYPYMLSDWDIERLGLIGISWFFLIFLEIFILIINFIAHVHTRRNYSI